MLMFGLGGLLPTPADGDTCAGRRAVAQADINRQQLNPRFLILTHPHAVSLQPTKRSDGVYVPSMLERWALRIFTPLRKPLWCLSSSSLVAWASTCSSHPTV
mmetsp:Transcript_112917/g.196023  ORF Transcript_112917/g.196023 Transcript_112917/m.196023 type:complete len:102 (-) Transcript_112917:208-513(-)